MKHWTKSLTKITMTEEQKLLLEDWPKELEVILGERPSVTLWDFIRELLAAQHAKSSEEQRVKDAEIVTRYTERHDDESCPMCDATKSISQKILNQPNS